MVGVRQTSRTCTNPENLGSLGTASARAYAGTSGKRQDKALTEELCDLQRFSGLPAPPGAAGSPLRGRTERDG
jgi:hypothetical protein